MVAIIGENKKHYAIGRFNFSTKLDPSGLVQILGHAEQRLGGFQACRLTQGKDANGQSHTVALVPCPGPEFQYVWIATSETLEEMEGEIERLQKYLDAAYERIGAIEAKLSENGK